MSESKTELSKDEKDLSDSKEILQNEDKCLVLNERATWASGLDFFLSALGYAVGIGNVWRFPYFCYKNGGGAFLIPYFICMFIIGMPMVYMEFIVGQFTSCGPLTAFKMTRFSKGLGLSINAANSFRLIFFNMIISYALYFFVSSFTSELPWKKCQDDWSSPNCVDNYSPEVFKYTRCDSNQTFLKCDQINSYNFGRCFNRTTLDGANASCSMDRQVLEQVGWWKTSFPSADYWTKMVLQKSASIDEPGKMVWQLALCYFGVYLIVYTMLVKGIKVSGKAVYVTALLPYFVLMILGFKAWNLPGADIGIMFYLKPRWEKLLDVTVWNDAATAIFFSISISFGGMTTLASYNKFNSNVMRDAISIPLANCFTSFFAGFVIFSYMGYLSHMTGQDIENIIEAGQGLAFVVYPYAVTTLVGAPIWSILFFFMLILLGVSSQVSNIEVTVTSILDAFPTLRQTNVRRYITVSCIFLFYFLCGLIFTFQSGTYWIEVFNTYTGDWAILIIGASECIIISYFYGLKNFRNDIEVMLGPKFARSSTYYFWCVMWSVICPLLCLIVAVQTFLKLKTVTIGDYIFPEWTTYFGIFIQIVVLMGLFGGGFYAICDVLVKKKPVMSVFKPNFDEYIPKEFANQKLVRIQRGQIKGEEKVVENLLA